MRTAGSPPTTPSWRVSSRWRSAARGEHLDPLRGQGQRPVVEEERRCVRNSVCRPVELVRAARTVERVSDRDLVAEDEYGVLLPRDDVPERRGVAKSRLVEALAAREAVGARVPALPLVVLVDRGTFELAHIDVVEARLDLRG